MLHLLAKSNLSKVIHDHGHWTSSMTIQLWRKYGQAQHTGALFLTLILSEGGWVLCVCYKAFIKGMKCRGVLSATSSFPRQVDLTFLKQPLQRAQSRGKVWMSRVFFGWGLGVLVALGKMLKALQAGWEVLCCK